MDRLPHQPHKVDVAINIDETLLLEKIWASVLGPEREKLESEWHWRYAHTFINFTLRILQHQGKISDSSLLSTHKEQTLRGLSVCSIGGTEACILAALGAQATCIGPELTHFPAPEKTTIVPHRLNPDIAQQYAEAFDVTMSRRVLDFGSGLDNSSYLGHQRHYLSFLLSALAMTKLNGISVHSINPIIFDGQLGRKGVREDVEKYARILETEKEMA